MKIAVTGGSGFIGKWVLQLLSCQHEFFVLGRRQSNPLRVANCDFCYLQTDYSLEQLLEQLYGAEAVIHLAAQRPVAAKLGLLDYFHSNFLVSANLFEACRLLSIKNIINLSSISVYTAENQLPWREDQQVQPLSYYGISKNAAENLAHYYNVNHQLCIKTLRVAHVLGWGDNGHFMVRNFIAKARQQKALPVYGCGEGRREYIYVKDVVGTIACALQHPSLNGTFNIGTGTAFSAVSVKLKVPHFNKNC